MDRAKILRLLNEADDIVSALYRQGANKDYKCKTLREKLNAIGTGCYRCAYNNGECDSGYGKGCIAGNLEWLRKEADEDASD